MPPHKIIDGEEFYCIEKVIAYKEDPEGDEYKAKVEVKWWDDEVTTWHRIDEWLVPGNDGAEAIMEYLKEAFGGSKVLYKEKKKGRWVYSIGENDETEEKKDGANDGDEQSVEDAADLAGNVPLLQQAQEPNNVDLDWPHENPGVNLLENHDGNVENEGEVQEQIEQWTHVSDHKLSAQGNDLFFVHWLNTSSEPSWEEFAAFNFNDHLSRKQLHKFISKHFYGRKPLRFKCKRDGQLKAYISDA